LKIKYLEESKKLKEETSTKEQKRNERNKQKTHKDKEDKNDYLNHIQQVSLHLFKHIHQF